MGTVPVAEFGSHEVLKYRIPAHARPRHLLLHLNFPSLDHNKVDPVLLDPLLTADKVASLTESENKPHNGICYFLLIASES